MLTKLILAINVFQSTINVVFLVPLHSEVGKGRGAPFFKVFVRMILHFLGINSFDLVAPGIKYAEIDVLVHVFILFSSSNVLIFSPYF